MNAARRQASLARRLLPTDRLIDLSHKQPWIIWMDLALIYVIFAAAMVLLATTTSLGGRIAAFLLIGNRQYALFLMGHDGVHGSLHPARRVNDAVSRWLIFAPLGMALGDARANHLEHHRWLGDSRDPDRYLHGADNKRGAVQFLLFLSGLVTFIRTVLKVTPFARSRRQTAGGGDDHPSSMRSFLAQRIPAMTVQVLVLTLISAWMPVTHYLIFWLLPIYLLVFLPDEVRAFSDHAHPAVPDTSVDRRRLITYVPNFAERLVFAPKNMNYHAEHHLWPSIPYYNLPKVHALVRTHDDTDIIVRKSYLGFLWRYYRSLPLDAARPTPATSSPTGAAAAVNPAP